MYFINLFFCMCKASKLFPFEHIVLFFSLNSNIKRGNLNKWRLQQQRVWLHIAHGNIINI